MWKCKKCKHILSAKDGSIHASTGYCPKCKEHKLLERYDPLNEEKTPPI